MTPPNVPVFVSDDGGDLINLWHMEAIMKSKIDKEFQEAPEGHTHEILAVNTAQESYRLFTGTEIEVDVRMDNLRRLLKGSL